MTKTSSKTAAIREAATRVSIHGRGTSWIIISPYDANDLSGPSQQSNACSYQAARRAAADRKACIALSLMGKLTEDALYAIQEAMYYDNVCDTRALVEIGLRKS